MSSDVFIRYHGTGNAWPVPLGSEHPFYDRTDSVQLANAAYSINVTSDGEEIEVLLDAGHGIIQRLLATSNKIPDVLCLTHGHLDQLFPEYHERLMLKSYLTAPHQRTIFQLSYHHFFEEFLATPSYFQCFTVFDFIRSLEPK